MLSVGAVKMCSAPPYRGGGGGGGGDNKQEVLFLHLQKAGASPYPQTALLAFELVDDQCIVQLKSVKLKTV